MEISRPRIFHFFAKSVLSAIFQKKCSSKVQNNTASSDRQISKNHHYTVLALLKWRFFHIVVINIGAKLKKIENCKKKFSFFFRLWAKSLLFTLLTFIRVSWTRKNGQKTKFSNFYLFVWGGWGIDKTLEIGSFDPKRPLKSPVSILSTSGGKYSNPKVSELCCPFRDIFLGPYRSKIHTCCPKNPQIL